MDKKPYITYFFIPKYRKKFIWIGETRCTGNYSDDAHVFSYDEKPVVYHWKYKLEEVNPNEGVTVDTLPIKKSS